MVDDRPQADRILVAQITGEARHRAKWRELSSDEEAAAAAELQALAGGRADLLAEVAGTFEGTSEGELDEPLPQGRSTFASPSRLLRLKRLVNLKERLLCLIEQPCYGLQREQILGLRPAGSSMDQQRTRHLVKRDESAVAWIGQARITWAGQHHVTSPVEVPNVDSSRCAAMDSMARQPEPWLEVLKTGKPFQLREAG